MALSPAYWPDKTERRLLGRFYFSVGISEVLNIIMPFRFVYLYMVMQRPEWAVIPLLVESATILLMEIPTGVVADRWGRKLSVITGGCLYTLSLLLVPFAVVYLGTAQLWAVCLCFVISGLGQTLVSGAEEAWVVDNLSSARRRDLVDHYFARIQSFASVGGVIAGLIALAILVSVDVTRSLLDFLWYMAAFGLFVSMLIATTIPEHRPDEHAPMTEVKTFLQRIVNGFQVILRLRPLLFLTLAIVIATFSGSVADEAFDISMITKGLDARALSPLGILVDISGVIAPLVGLTLARRYGASLVLSWFLILPAILVGMFFFQPALWLIVVLYILLAFFDGVWDPVASAKLHSMISSATRATVGSTVNQLGGMANLAGIGMFAVFLGEHSEAMQQATPDLVQAFSGGQSTHVDVPLSLFGLPVPDLAIVVFVAAGLLAVPFLLLGGADRKTDKLSTSGETAR